MEHHGAALHLLTNDHKLVEDLKEDYRIATIDKKSKLILDYAVKLTKKPSDIGEDDIEVLKSEGCTDVEILDICQIVSYFNFVNRMAEGLGVKLERR
ncbi:peroxidase [Metabacillus indicus]|uniref:peroxidase n=1 Tax=Metabacillus indicus TaxID=246786 RepID=UPI003CF17D21